jgi:Cu/Ag efflux pump CusA
MLQRLIEWSARHAMVVAVMAIGALVAVGLMLPRLPVDVFPELNAPTVVIMAEAGGLAAEDVERGVVFPIEVAVQGLPDLRRLRSASSNSKPDMIGMFQSESTMVMGWRVRLLSASRDVLSFNHLIMIDLFCLLTFTLSHFKCDSIEI